MATTYDPAQHPAVLAVVRRLEQNREGMRPWDSIEVTSQPVGSRGRHLVSIYAESYPGTLASTIVHLFVVTSGPRRAAFKGGSVYALSSDRQIKNWREMYKAF